MKKNSPLAAYKTARTNLWILLALSAVNVLFALLGSDTYFLFSCFISYLVAIYARVFYDYTWDPVYLVIGILIALVILVVYLLCCLLSKKRRGWLIAALVLFSVDTAAMLLYYVIELSVTDILTDILDFVIHGLVLWILISGVRRSREALEGADTPESLPMNTEFYDASQGAFPTPPPWASPRIRSTAFSCPPSTAAMRSRSAAATASRSSLWTARSMAVRRALWSPAIPSAPGWAATPSKRSLPPAASSSSG